MKLVPEDSDKEQAASPDWGGSFILFFAFLTAAEGVAFPRMIFESQAKEWRLRRSSLAWDVWRGRSRVEHWAPLLCVLGCIHF